MTKALISTRYKVASILRKEHGATAVEYGLMVALIAVVIIIAVLTLGNKLSSLFDDTATQI
jgi:pilus assembly protein Flp/PilA